MQPNHFEALLEVADDSLILGQRLCEWCGHAPTIEVDLSLSNLALDLIGQATLLLDYAGELEGKGRTADRLAFHRDAEAFRNSMLLEQPNSDFARTVMRHFLFAAYANPLFEALARSPDARLAEIAAKSIKELRYHLEYATDWLERLGQGTDESHRRIANAFDWNWRFVDDLFFDSISWKSGAEIGLWPLRADLRPAFDETLSAGLALAGLAEPKPAWPIVGGRMGKHSEHLSSMLTVMQVLPRAHPEATW